MARSYIGRLHFLMVTSTIIIHITCLITVIIIPISRYGFWYLGMAMITFIRIIDIHASVHVFSLQYLSDEYFVSHRAHFSLAPFIIYLSNFKKITLQVCLSVFWRFFCVSLYPYTRLSKTLSFVFLNVESYEILAGVVKRMWCRLRQKQQL
jgi:hypothetical protein